MHKVTNLTNSPHDLTVRLPAMGAVEAVFAPEYLEALKGLGYFEITDATAIQPAAEPGPLDQSVEALTEHLATVDDLDDIQSLIDAETAGKSRKGALAALEARRDQLLV